MLLHPTFSDHLSDTVSSMLHYFCAQTYIASATTQHAQVKSNKNITEHNFINQFNKFSVICSLSLCTWCLNSRRHAFLVKFYASNTLEQSEFRGVLRTTWSITYFFQWRSTSCNWAWTRKRQTGNMDRSAEYAVTECKRTPTRTHTHTYRQWLKCNGTQGNAVPPPPIYDSKCSRFPHLRML